MTVGLCVCVLLMVLCISCLGCPHSSPLLQEGRPALPPASEARLETARLEAKAHFLSERCLRHARSAPLVNTNPYTGEEGGDSRAKLNELLARLISSRKGYISRNSTVNSRARGLRANHLIKDQDYTGWMDFGRRSAQEEN
ncbi:cholecystokinin-like [Coregonus clupeaformis]|uniref:cholecystokinin-like n=1 Tax=Coregonus clupeaformis TaxID=59861 RepID=UPI001BE1258D|nr:cholecystokinin-like [Coregonus clupeaformis]